MLDLRLVVGTDGVVRDIWSPNAGLTGDPALRAVFLDLRRALLSAECRRLDRIGLAGTDIAVLNRMTIHLRLTGGAWDRTLP